MATIRTFSMFQKFILNKTLIVDEGQILGFWEMLTWLAFSLFSMNILANIAEIQPQSYPSTFCHATLTFSVKKKKKIFHRQKFFLPGLLLQLAGRPT